MEKRKWVYILPPTSYDMRCDKCWSGKLDDRTGTNIAWSEYEHKIWCYDCKIDTEGFKGIFDGPIPIQTSYLLGITFDRFNLETEQVEKFNLKTNKWDPPKVVKANLDPKEKTKKLLKDEEIKDPYGKHLREEGSKYFELVPRSKKEKA